MKHLVKLFAVVIVVTMITDEIFAQNFGLKAGLNLSNMLIKDDDDTYSDDYKMNPGFHVGAIAEFPLSGMFSFETGLLLSTKGFKASEEEIMSGEPSMREGKINLLYLDMPLTAKASFNIGGAEIYGVFGPYAGMGLSGKYKTENNNYGDTQLGEVEIKWGSDKIKSDFKRLDVGLKMGAGVEINAILIDLTYSLGLANISPNTDGGTMINNRVVGLSAGYKFGRK